MDWAEEIILATGREYGVYWQTRQLKVCQTYSDLVKTTRDSHAIGLKFKIVAWALQTVASFEIIQLALNTLNHSLAKTDGSVLDSAAIRETNYMLWICIRTMVASLARISVECCWMRITLIFEQCARSFRCVGAEREYYPLCWKPD